MNHLDLSLWAFEQLADIKYGVIGLRWRPVDCALWERGSGTAQTIVNGGTWTAPAFSLAPTSMSAELQSTAGNQSQIQSTQTQWTQSQSQASSDSSSTESSPPDSDSLATAGSEFETAVPAGSSDSGSETESVALEVPGPEPSDHMSAWAQDPSTSTSDSLLSRFRAWSANEGQVFAFSGPSDG